ncbi:MAG TPA: class I SAM-dependent methyltransferase family protein [Candidatus Bathyarchaeia archaeon]|jgi:tRNA (guanine37-N1)-methyltransferase|nr:class I SAM-dependent methyltransferase family protein [Candidatus Bathyarchaeia archaeon]
MRKKSACIKIPKQQGQKAIILGNKLGIINNELQVQRDQNFLYIPLVSKPSQDELESFKEQIEGCVFSTYTFTEQKKSEPSLTEMLDNKLPPHLLASLPHSVDFVGDIAIIEIPPELDPYKNLVGQTVLQMNQNLRTVLAKAGAVSGTYRLREFNVIAGEPQTETIHKEYGCQYYVDVAKAYFSPRLSHEHNRVASLVKEGETVVDLFAGVGPFAIPIAKNHKDVKIYAVDINQCAVEFLKRNIRLNRVQDSVHPILGDAKQVAKEQLSNIADRVIMNLPEKAIDFVDAACKTVKSTGGIVHFYFFVNASESFEDVKLRFAEEVEKCGRKVERFVFFRLVRETAPYEWQAVLDAEIG